MCTTTRAGARLRAPAAEQTPPPTDCDVKGAAHSEAYDRALVDGAGAGEADWAEPVRRLPLRELALDPAVVVFILMHVVAFATPWWAGGVTRKDAAIVVASYTARMFGAQLSRGCGVQKARGLPPPAAPR